ncbi:MetQ/NlpA family ABC transporter substrate-binding protein [Parafrankia sp. FMc2]|uniref:MetQ/NlpA family ABC transporter substrate-binding protein n=1 Tax=Parafrankia sp. FMc2 TaxID=3233196 RepID=UPI0034D6CF9F
MRRVFLPIAVSVLATTLTLGACSDSDDGGAGGDSGDRPIRIGASPTPHAEILQFVQDELAAEAGLRLDIVEYTDYIQPNVALSEGDLDANYFQHLPYYEVQVAERGYDFGHFPGIHIEPYAAYSETVDDVADLRDGARVGITNDPSNQARALDLLVGADLITLDDTGEEDPTLLDVADNPKNLEFVETDPEQLPRSLQDFDLAIINGNYALEGGLNPATDSLLIESGEDNPYANFVAVRAEDIDDPRLVRLDELLHSTQVRTFVTTRWPKGEVLPAF